MLNSKCRKILNCLINFNENNIDIEGFKTFQAYLPSFSTKDLILILNYLTDTGYLIYETADDDLYRVELTYKGLAYKSFNFEEFKSFLLKSVFVPIVVSFTTTLLTILLQGL